MILQFFFITVRDEENHPKWEKIIELQTLIEWIGPDKSQETKTEITPTCKASYLFIFVLKDSYYIW